MRNNESFRTTETEKSRENGLVRQEKKLIRYYLSGGDDRYIFNSNRPEFNEAAVDEEMKAQALRKIRGNEKLCREMDSQLLHNMSRSGYYESDDRIFQGMKDDKHQKRILAYMTGVKWNDYDSVSGSDLGRFLEKYPTPIEFEEDSDKFLRMIGDRNGEAKHAEYVTSMDEFCQQAYGKKWEYYKTMQGLRKEAEQQRAAEELAQKKNQRRGGMILSLDFFGEKSEKKGLVAEAGMASLNKGDLTRERGRQNEDASYFNLEDGCFGVFDGAGGTQGAARASGIAAAVMQKMVEGKKPSSAGEMAEILKKASDAIYYDEAAGHSTGVVGSIIERGSKKFLVYASVGDSRIYLVRNNKAEQITIDEGYRNIITNSLGRRDAQVRQMGEVPLKKGDRLVFCSDGITGDVEKDFIPDEEFGAIVGRAASATEVANSLVRRATKVDDRTAVVVEV